jgi:hypothetical protein
MTLGELLDIDYKQKSLTLTELTEALQGALTLPIISQQPPIQTSIAAVTAALTVYTTTITVYEKLLALMPSIKIAVKAAAIPLNPAMAQEVAQDILLQAQSLIMEQAKNLVINLKDTILNTEIPGT